MMERHLEREIEELRGQLAKTNEELAALTRDRDQLRAEAQWLELYRKRYEELQRALRVMLQ